MLEAYARHERTRWRQLATLGSWVLAPWTRITPAALLGWRDE